MPRHHLRLFLSFFLTATTPTWAVDHNNLDEGRPLQIEDAYPIAYGELSAETGVRVSHDRHGDDRVAFPLELLYGAYWNLHLGLGSTLATSPHAIDDPEKSGDLRLFGLYNFNQETLRIPALAMKLTLDSPSGLRSRGVDTELKGILTHTVGHGRVHLNAGYQFIGHARDGERDGRYEVVLGAQYPWGYPRSFTTTLLADLFTRQSTHGNDTNNAGVEIGLRRQIAPLVIVDAGIGTEFVGPSDREIFFATVGISFGF
jgi:hypothetical protein